MANNEQNTSSNDVRRYDAGLNEGIRDYHSKDNQWTFARNASPNSVTGDVGDIGNESANALCVKAPYTIIGSIYLFADTWAIFSTDDTNCEIGKFQESTCTYSTVVNDACLNFKRTNLITGISKQNHDCSWWVYWADDLNPDRALNFDKPQFIKLCTDSAGNTQLGNNPPSSTAYPVGCITCVDTTALDCDAIRLAHLVTPPCWSVKGGAQGGNLPNGSYFITGAYKINGQKITDYFTPSNVQPLFSHSNVAGSLDIIVASADTRFDELEIVLVSVVNQQTSARILGTYSTHQSLISVDIIDNKLTEVPLSLIPLHTPIIDKSEAIYEVGDYAIRVAPTQKFDFNYQPLANQIVAKWQSVEYSIDYYRKGGNKTNYLRDEVYPYFIQWEYDDGDLSSSYHIPGRPSMINPISVPNVGSVLEFGTYPTEGQIELSENLVPLGWMVYNTAFPVGPTTAIPTDDGGFIIQEGYMGYWESSEKYPDDKSMVWNATDLNHPWTQVTTIPYPGTTPGSIAGNVVTLGDYDLCGKNIRHHKFPEERVLNCAHYTSSSPNFGGAPAIRIMGVKFENIQRPVDNNGNPIPGIVGYRILRGSREGNKSIIAKGMLNDVFHYNVPNSSKVHVYPNFPYNDVGQDDYISQIDTMEMFCTTIGVPNTMSPSLVTFHSPDTNFREPFLSTKELKIYGEMHGDVSGQFVEPDKHPKHKLVTDAAFVVSVIAGIGIAALEMNGKKTTSYNLPRTIDLGGVFVGSSSGTIPDVATYPTTTVPTISTSYTLQTVFDTISNLTGLQTLANAGGQGTSLYYSTLEGTELPQNFLDGTLGYSKTIQQDNGAFDNIPGLMTFLAPGGVIVPFLYYWSQGTDQILDLIRAIVPYNQYALQYQSHCFYNLPFGSSAGGQTRRLIQEAAYIDGQIQDFGNIWTINNLYRGKCVALETAPITPPGGDNSKQTVHRAVGSGLLGGYSKQQVVGQNFQTHAASHYGALKVRIRNQYGQLASILQIPIHSCMLDTTSNNFPFSTGCLFGGDTYIGRYTEKNTMPFFYDWMYDQPDGFEFDYHSKKNVLHPKYWMDTRKFDMSEFLSSIGSNILGPYTTPSSLHALDRGTCTGFFEVREAYMYLFCSGVRDFFVESEINIDLRDWEDVPQKRHYDPRRYTDLATLFNAKPEIITSGNFYKYDYSLSISKLFMNFISWANVQPINYDPFIYESCYVHYPNRIIYSLPQQHEQIKDFWLVYLPNNYKDFKTHVTCIKPINKSGAIFLFETASPMQIVGVDTLQTGTGVSVTVGDGTLFNLPIQSLLNAEQSFEYGACQNSRSVINTPMGVFWMSQDQGKIFNLQNGVQEISLDVDMKWWFAQYLPYRLTQQFPNFQLKDNPVIGIGCQTIFDNENTLVYFMKRDYQVRQDLPPGTTVTYVSGNDFMVNGLLPVKLGDPAYFEDASWTVSFDPKTQEWIGWHDWHPELCLPGKNTFLTTQTAANGQGGVWRHNEVCDLYCNYYGKDYPFEVEYRVNTATQVNTLRSVEHFVEFYLYDKNNCHDRYLQLLEYFDRGVVYNQEQVSGYLNLVPTPNNNPFALTNYPIINPNSIDILYSKVESKYRWNQFWDVTDDRGQFSAAKRMIWNTAANGYVKVLNPANINYQKSEFQRKAIRGYTHSVWLQKKVCGASKILAILTVDKQLYSPR